MIESLLSETDLKSLEKNPSLLERVLSKFLKLQGARVAAQIKDANQLESMSRSHIERYRQHMLGLNLPSKDDDEDGIVVADDINQGLSGRTLIGILLLVSLMSLSSLAAGYFFAGRNQSFQDQDTQSTVRFEE